ncbi:MAG: hypothetical protein WCT18_01570, partial [Patescibacteria group bacterium]
MTVRLITSDKDLRIVFKVLLCELREKIKSGKSVIFLPWKFVLPEDEIEIKEKDESVVNETGEKLINFSFEAEDAEIDSFEALRLLGVTLYHLVTGKSELTHESYLLDGYRRPLNSSLWPIILLLLKEEEQDIEKIEEMIDAVDPDEIKSNIQLPQPAIGAIKTGKTRTADDIIRELAKEKIKIIGHERVANFWGISVPQDVRIRYSEETLREAIVANQSGEQWALAYYAGHSARQMRAKWGVNKNTQPCIYNNDWWLKDKEDYWATKTLEPGYYLLNFNGKFDSKKWSEQENLITGLGPMYERAHEFVVGETVLSNFNIHNGERLLENWYHWGKESSSADYRVC